MCTLYTFSVFHVKSHYDVLNQFVEPEGQLENKGKEGREENKGKEWREERFVLWARFTLGPILKALDLQF